MKKTLVIIAVACIAFAMPAQAQVKFGLKGGLNLTSLSADGGTSGVSNQAGFFVGPTVKFTVPLVGLSLDASALFDQRSVKNKSTDETIKSQTVQIPVNIRYGVGLSSIANVFAFVGPQFGFNVGDKGKELKYAGEWSLKTSNISGNAGVGATVLGKLQITANYNFQLSKTGVVEYKVPDPNDPTKTITSSGKMKFNSWQIGLAYFF